MRRPGERHSGKGSNYEGSEPRGGEGVVGEPFTAEPYQASREASRHTAQHMDLLFLFQVFPRLSTLSNQLYHIKEK